MPRKRSTDTASPTLTEHQLDATKMLATLLLANSQHSLVSILPTTKRQKIELMPFSNSRLEACNQCPRFGVVNAQRQYATTARAMALEAGQAMHQVFAAVRVWQLKAIQKLPRHSKAAGDRIFGKERFKDAWNGTVSAEGEREHLLEFCFNILHTSGFYDDPNDNVRTLSNMELATIQFVDENLKKMHNWHVHVFNKKDPTGLVCIEVPFDVVVTYDDGRQIRYVGTLDALLYNVPKKKLYIEDNKTASRLDTGWREALNMRHQFTGYCGASTTVFGFSVFDIRVHGVKIKPTGRGEDCLPIETSRKDEDIETWARWLRATVDVYEAFKNDYEHAPLFTHSCNRYFRPCSLLSFCGDTVEGRMIQWDEMVPAEPSPSEKAVMEI